MVRFYQQAPTGLINSLHRRFQRQKLMKKCHTVNVTENIKSFTVLCSRPKEALKMIPFKNQDEMKISINFTIQRKRQK